MATIDLGKIKLVWRGTYNASTAYTVDDVVQHTDSGLTSSFICTTASTGNAPSTGGSVHSSWAYLAKGGVAGTDVGTTITTQGDILYRDGSGLQRLAKGTAGQALIMNTAANAPEWGAAGVGGTKGFYAYRDANSSDLNNSANNEIVFTHEKHDDDSLYDTSNGRYTPGVVGTYFVTSSITLNSINGTGDDAYLKFFVSGSSAGHQYGSTHYSGGGASYSPLHASAVIKITSASDYISVWIYHDAGNSRQVQGGQANFSGFRLT